VISGDVRRAIARAIAAEGLGPADPGLRPTGVPGRFSSSVAFAFGERRPDVAARIAARLTQTDGIARADITGPGFLTITVAPEELAALPARIANAGPACAASDALTGSTVAAPPAADPLAEASWEKARAALAAQLTARLAAAAGATVAIPEDMERSRASPNPEHFPSTAEAKVRRSAKSPSPLPSQLPPQTAATGEDPPAQEPNPVARAVAYAGADAVRFSLARAVPGRPVQIDRLIIARHLLGNPAYAVRYAHARAASGVRWAATSQTMPAGGRAVLRPLPPNREELELLDVLSWLPERVATAARRGRPDEFARYLEELASASIAALIRVGDPGTPRAPVADRLAMARAARTGLAAGLGLLGVGAPDRL